MTEIQIYEPQDWYEEVPRRVHRIGLLGVMLMLIAFGGFGFWSFRAPLAAAVIAPGSFVATGSNKIVQHLEGGIIKSILVKEGDEVEEGQPLVILDDTAAQTRKTELEIRLARLNAINARLLAEYQGLEEIDFPPELLAMNSNQKVADIIDGQKVNFAMSRQKQANDIRLIEANITALEQRIEGFSAQRDALGKQVSILTEDLENKSSLFEKGLIRKPDINALMRALAEGEGQIARLDSQINESETLIGKYRRQIDQTRQVYYQAALDEIQSVQAELDSVSEKLLSAEAVLERTVIKSPVSGTVVRMYYHTPGGVIEGGKAIVEILPKGAPLIIEALVQRTEIDSISIGQMATVRLVALNRRTTPVLNGEVFYISADALPDTSVRGRPREVYLTRVRLAPSEMKRVPGFTPTPGMPAQVLVKTQERTFFQYMTKPIVDSMSRAFREN